MTRLKSNLPKKIVIDQDIPYIKDILEDWFDVKYLKGDSIKNKDIKEAEILIIRTRTKCNSILLEGTSVKYILTATIGLDHVDLQYCANNNIEVYNAAGSNALGVVQYVFTSLFYLQQKFNYQLKGKTLGIIGAGNVGERVAKRAPYFSLEVLRNDPPLKRQLLENPLAFKNDILRKDLTLNDFKELDFIFSNSDIITIHTPLDSTTRGLIDIDILSKLKRKPIIINTSRGEVINEEALLLMSRSFSYLVLDVWNNEPYINKHLCDLADIATPHIAGYSIEGKANATTFVINKIGELSKIHSLISFKVKDLNYDNLDIDLIAPYTIDNLSKAIFKLFPIEECIEYFKANPNNFETYRNNYKYRKEIPENLYNIIKMLD